MCTMTVGVLFIDHVNNFFREIISQFIHHFRLPCLNNIASRSSDSQFLWLYENNDRFFKKPIRKFFNIALINSRISVLNRIHEDHAYMLLHDSSFYERALHSEGKKHTLSWLKKKGYLYNSDLFYHVNSVNFYSDHLVREWVNDELIFFEEEFYHVILRGNLRKIDWVINSVPKLKSSISYLAARGNKIDVLRWCISNHYELTVDAAIVAAQTKNLKILKLLFRHQCPMSHIIPTEAVINRDVEMLEWCCDNKIPLEKWAMYEAIKNNDERKNCPIDAHIMKLLHSFVK